MNRCLAMIFGVLLLTGCTSQNQSPAHDPFANRTTFPPPATGEAAKDPYYSAAPAAPSAFSTGAPGIAAAPAPGLSVNSANATTVAANPGSIPPPSSNAVATRGIALQGARGTNSAASGYRAPVPNGWATAGTGGVAEDRIPRPTTDATGVSSAGQNVTTQNIAPRAPDANFGQLRDISELPRNL
jgi:hypothetical protein